MQTFSIPAMAHRVLMATTIQHGCPVVLFEHRVVLLTTTPQETPVDCSGMLYGWMAW